MYNIANLSFKNIYTDGSITWEDVYYNGIIIGSFGTKRNAFLKEQECFYQICVDEKFKNYGDKWYISEDVGKVFVVFYGINSDEKLYNLYTLQHEMEN